MRPMPGRALRMAASAHSHDHGHTDGHHHHGGGHEGGHPHSHAHAGPPDPNALISARALTVRRDGRVLLEGIDLDIQANEIVTVIGPNGAGKTTLVRSLLGLMKFDGGTVVKRPGLKVGYAPQRFDVDRALPMTAGRFLQLGGQHSAGQLAAALGEVGATRVIDQQITSLSGGELQRVVLARALLREPDLLVLDEPVRGVDYAGEAELYELIGRLRDTHGLAVLMVSHDLHVVMAKSDRVVCINRHVCCSGVPHTVARDPEYVRLFGAEAARAFAVYQHEHDHRHDLAGGTAPAEPSKE